MGIIWALARNTIIQAFRMRAAIVLIVLFFIAAPLLLFNVGDDLAEDGRTERLIRIEADGTQVGEVKLLLSYSVTIASILLMVLTILLSASVLDVEIVKKYAFLICSKPVRRWQIMVGKWLGIVLLDAGLLFIMGILILGATWYFSRTDPIFPEGRQKLMESVLISQRSIKPDTLNLEKEFQKLRIEMLKEGASEDTVNKQVLRPKVKTYLEECTVRIPPYGIMAFRLKNVPIAEIPEKTMYTMRFKLYSEMASDFPLTVRWRISRKNPDYVAIIDTRSRDSEVGQFKVPAVVVDDNGEVLVEVQNLAIGDPSAKEPIRRQSYPITLSMMKGMELLAPIESSFGKFLTSINSSDFIRDLAELMPFIMNFFKALLLLLVRLAMLAAIGVAATSILHFPVAMLVLLLVVFLASTRDVYASILTTTIRRETPAADTAETEPHKGEDKGSTNILEKISKPIWKFTLQVITRVPPRFADTDPVPDFTVGREIGMARILAQCFRDLILRGGIIFAIGLFLFYRREIGRPEI